MDRFRSILNSTFVTTYKRTLTVLFIFALTLAIPVTILLVQQRQDLRQQAAGIATISGVVKDQTGQPVDIPNASVTLVNVAGGTPRTGNIKPDGTYTFQIFQTGTFRLGIKLPANYSINPTPKSTPDPITITSTTKNVTNLNFSIKVPALTDKDVAGRFNTACVNKLSGWGCVIKKDSKKVTVKFYKGTSSNGVPIKFVAGSEVANKVGKSEIVANPPEDPVGAEKACQLPGNLADHHVYHFTPLPGQLKPGDKVVGYMTGVIDTQSNSSQVKPLSPNIQMNGLQPKTILPVDAPDCQDNPPVKTNYSISGIIFVDKDGDKKYDSAKDRPYFGNNNKTVIVQRSGCDPKDITPCQTEAKGGGRYTFSNLAPATYQIDIVKDKEPDKRVYTSDTTRPLTKTVNSKTPKIVDADFGFKVIGADPVAQKFRVSGTVLVKTPAGQRPYRGAQGPATIKIEGKSKDGKNVKETTTTTVAANGVVGIGSYSFDKEQQVPEGTYVVSVTLPTAAQTLYTILDPKSVSLNVKAVQKGVNFLLQAKGTPPENQNFGISGIVYVESSAVKDVGSEYNPGADELFKGANISLIPECPNNTGVGGQCIAGGSSAESDANGKYQFENQASGKRYTVTLTMPDGYRAATPNSRSFDLVKNRTDVNFGIIAKGDEPPVDGQANLAISIKMPGIGLGTSNNNNPLRPDREADVVVYNSSNDEIANQTTTVTYDPTSGLYKGTVTLDQVPGGTYAVKARLDNTLFRFFRSPETNNPLIDVATDKTTTLPTLTLIAGDLDINQDSGQRSLLDVFDYDKILSCMRNEDACSENDKILADFNDDGTLDDGRDLNILFQGLGVREGE